MAVSASRKSRSVATDNDSDLELYVHLLHDDAGARDALARLYKRYSQRVYTYCRKILGDNELAEDILQETFLKVYESGKIGRVLENFPAYLMTIARNLCFTHKVRRAKPYVPLEDFHLVESDTPYEQKELLNLVKKSLDLLPDDYREAFILREYNGLSYNEIAEVIGQSLEIVKIRIFRSKKRIRSILAPYLKDLNKEY